MSSRGLLLALFIALASACGGSSPAGPDTPAFPDVQGTWRGAWNSQDCQALGSIAPGTCANQRGAFGFSLTQSGGALNGTLQVCGGRVAVTATISQDGVIALLTQAPVAGTSPTAIGSWGATVNGSFMTGLLSCNVQLGATPQDAIVMIATLDDISRVSSDPNAGF